jgi:hypothetical protein
MTRRVVQIAASESSKTHMTVVALCDDGSIWQITPDTESILGPSWKKLPEIPAKAKRRGE